MNAGGGSTVARMAARKNELLAQTTSIQLETLMNETNFPRSTPDVTWPTPDYERVEPDASALADSDNAAPTAAGLLNNAVQGAHHTIDRLADRAKPAVEQLGESALAAQDALHVKADQLRETRDEWVESARTTVRSNPLVAVAAAVTLGLVIARITR